MYTCSRANPTARSMELSSCPARPDERLAPAILLRAGRLTDDEPVGLRVAHAKHRLRARRAKPQRVQAATRACSSSQSDARLARGVDYGQALHAVGATAAQHGGSHRQRGPAAVAAIGRLLRRAAIHDFEPQRSQVFLGAAALFMRGNAAGCFCAAVCGTPTADGADRA